MDKETNTVNFDWDQASPFGVKLDDIVELGAVDEPTLPIDEEIIIGDDDVEEDELDKGSDNDIEKEKEKSSDKPSIKEEKEEKKTKKEDKKEKVEDENKDEDEEEGEATFEDYLSALVDKGYLNEEDVENIDSLEDLISIQEKIAEEKVNEKLEGLEDKFGDIGVKFLKFINEGGTPEEFFDMYSNMSDTISFDENRAGDEEVIKFYLKRVRSMSNDEIEDYLDTVKNKDKLDYYASKYRDEISKWKEEEEKKILEMKKKQNEEIRRKQQEFMNTLKNELKDPKSIFGMDLSKREIEKIEDFIFSNTTVDGNTTTKLHRRFTELISDPKNVAKLAYLVANDFDFSSIIKKAETEAVKKTKRIITKGTTQRKEKNKKTLPWDNW